MKLLIKQKPTQDELRLYVKSIDQDLIECKGKIYHSKSVQPNVIFVSDNKFIAVELSSDLSSNHIYNILIRYEENEFNSDLYFWQTIHHERITNTFSISPLKIGRFIIENSIELIETKITKESDHLLFKHTAKRLYENSKAGLKDKIEAL